MPSPDVLRVVIDKMGLEDAVVLGGVHPDLEALVRERVAVSRARAMDAERPAVLSSHVRLPLGVAALRVGDLFTVTSTPREACVFSATSCVAVRMRRTLPEDKGEVCLTVTTHCPGFEDLDFALTTVKWYVEALREAGVRDLSYKTMAWVHEPRSAAFCAEVQAFVETL